jgi:exodeoxyribonuclease-1
MISATNYIFYDTETSGLNKMFGQIFQFAAILTDVNFQSLDQFEIRSRRMPHIVPDPGALIVTGVKPEQLESAADTYYSFAPKIREKLLSWSPAIF